MGPSCEVLLVDDSPRILDAIDAILALSAERIDRTRKGRVWDVWIRGQPVHIHVEKQLLMTLSAGCNHPEAFIILREIASRIVDAVGGIYSEPDK
jgi:hypothetical protein